MKNILFIFLAIMQCTSCASQSNFNQFIQNFNEINLPLEDIQRLTITDTLNGKLTNDIIIRNQKEKPKYVSYNDKLKTVDKYYGLYPEEPDDYLKDVKNNKGEWEEKRFYFYPKISPIGKLDLNEDYISLIIKVVGFETTFYDLWNFSKDGKALSVICLFWGLRDDGPKSEEVTYTIVDSKITNEGLIKWHENADGLETFRTYKLNEDGYFEIIKEEQKGEYEF